MKTLVLSRHAKSSWSHGGLSDFERPLNARGERDAPRMGQRLAESGVEPDLIVASPAKRAAATARHLAVGVGYAEDRIQWDEEIYAASVEKLLNIIAALDDAAQCALLVGHNPGFGELALHWNKSFTDNLPTSGIVHLEIDTEGWAMAPASLGAMVDFLYPKQDAED